MKQLIYRCLVLNIVLIMLASTALASPGNSNYLHIGEVTVEVVGSDMNATVHFQLDGFAKFYVMLFGSKTLNEGIESFFSSFDDVEVVKIGRESAVVVLHDVFYEESGYMLFQEKELGGPIDQLYIVFPDGAGRPQEIRETDSIPNLFYRL